MHAQHPAQVSVLGCAAPFAACLQAWPSNDLLVQYSVWRDSITSVVQVEPPAPESGEALGTFAVSVMPPGPEEVVCFPRDVVFVFDRSGSMTGGCWGWVWWVCASAGLCIFAQQHWGQSPVRRDLYNAAWHTCRSAACVGTELWQSCWRLC